jgi:hypothetical protein
MASEKIVTPEFVGSFITVLEARSIVNPDGTKSEPKFSLTAVFPPDGNQKYLSGKADLTALRKAATEVAIAKFGEKRVKELLKAGKFRTPFLQDDSMCEKYGWPEGSTFLRLSSKQRPGVVSCYKGADGRPMTMTADQIEEKLYPGARLRATVNAYAWEFQNMNRGVSFGLHNIQWLGDDERIDGKSKAEEDFEATSDEVADMTPESEGTEEQAAPAPAAKSAQKAKAPKAAPATETPDISLVL